MADVVPLAEAVAELVGDGDQVALEGFSHLVPFAAGHELIRQGRRDLHVVRMTPDLIVDQMLGAGCVATLTFSWAGNPGLGSLPRFRDAVENGWPRPITLHEHSHAGLANAYVAGASGLPFAVVDGFAGTDLVEHSPAHAPITCPFTGAELTAVAAVRPDVAVIHAQRADRRGNVQIWGVQGVQREAVLAARRALVTVEEVVDVLEPRPGAVLLPGWAISAVAEAPGGAAPSYVEGYTERDVATYRAWSSVARDRVAFAGWLAELGVVAAGGRS